MAEPYDPWGHLLLHRVRQATATWLSSFYFCGFKMFPQIDTYNFPVQPVACLQ